MVKVSVIIPTYNRAQMVCDAIDSVLAQKYADLEVLVVDDGSTDETGTLLARRYVPRIRYLHQENQGRAVARNHAIRAATGECFIFLDSDDWLLPGAVEIQTAFLAEHADVGVVYGDGYYADENGVPIQRISEERPAIPEEGLLAVMILHNVVVATHSAMVRRQALDLLGDPWFDPRLRGTEDADLWLRLAAAGVTFAAHDQPVCRYRLHGDNATSRFHPQRRRRWRSVQDSKRKVLESDFFPALPVATRREFLRQLLLVFFEGEPGKQEAILRSDQFRALPAADQAALLYYLGIETIVGRQALDLGRGWLNRAARLPSSLRSRLAVLLSYPYGLPLSCLVRLRRSLGPRRTDRSLAPHWRGAMAGK